MKINLVNWDNLTHYEAKKELLKENNLDAFFDCSTRKAIIIDDNKITEFDKIFIDNFCEKK